MSPMCSVIEYFPFKVDVSGIGYVAF